MLWERRQHTNASNEIWASFSGSLSFDWPHVQVVPDGTLMVSINVECDEGGEEKNRWGWGEPICTAENNYDYVTNDPGN